MRTFVIPALCLAALLPAAAPTSAGTWYAATDVPAQLGGVPITGNVIAQRTAPGAWSQALTLPGGTRTSALHRLPDGTWLVVPADRVQLGGLWYGPRDVVRTDGSFFMKVFDGAAAGLPADARIDALYQGQRLILSFDVPVTIGTETFSRSDLVSHTPGGFGLYWDAEGAGVPAASNVVGADRAGDGRLVITFDIPTTLGNQTFLPGQLVAWNTAGFALYAAEPQWPASAQLRDFGLAPPAGSVPAGGPGSPDVPLEVTRLGSDLLLTWGAASCSTSDTDYAVYMGIIGAWYSHEPAACSTGATQALLSDPNRDVYFLVVPLNAVSEGSYGLDGQGVERPASALACRPQAIATACQ
jgi:hypothetical protein